VDVRTLLDLDSSRLADYLWRRLRLEPPLDPPIAQRYGPEAPEQVFLEALTRAPNGRFRERLVHAVGENLQRLARQQAALDTSPTDPVTDQQIASLAFLATELEAKNLVSPLYLLACSWLMSASDPSTEITDARFHILRALARLQADAKLEPFWRALWEKGPPSIAGLSFCGWAYADPPAALAHLAELADLGSEIDLPTTLWSLSRAYRPGLSDVAAAAARLSASQRDALRRALAEAGADAVMLRDFDLIATPPVSTAGGFPWPAGTAPRNANAAKQRLRWAA
jgi:hypothetical protein